MTIRSLNILTIAAFAFSCNTASAQDLLQWKFRSQETLKYNVVQNMKTTMAVGGNTVQNTTMNQAMDMSWQIQGSAAGGETVMNQVVDRIRMKMEGGAGGTIEFDTQSKEIPQNPIIASMGETFQKIVGQPFKVTMAGSGKISNVDVPGALLDAIKQGSAGNASALDEKTLKQMMMQSAVMLPTQPVGPNSSWDSNQKVELPFGTMNIDSKMTFMQKDAQGNAIIDVVPSISVTPKEGAPVKINLTSSTGRGQVTFNIIQGRVSKSRLDLTLGMKIEAANGQVFDQTIVQTTAMTLAQ